MHNCSRLFGAAGMFLAFSTPAWAADITVSNGWFRALPSGQPAGGYFTMKNSGSRAVELIAAESSACGMLMLHQTLATGGMSRMEDVKSVSISPGGTVSFAPGHYHLMCMSPSIAMTPGKTVIVTLVFSDGSRAHAQFVVKNAAGE